MPNTPAGTPTISGLSLRRHLVPLLGPMQPLHDEAGDLYRWRGEEVRVKEKLRVESQDPSLMAVLAKLAALEHAVAESRTALAVVMADTVN